VREVLVIGSANVDVSVTTQALPLPGETVTGSSALISVGGKGANQAVAAARCGAATAFAGCIGDDAFGDLVRAELAQHGVRLDVLRSVAGVGTGLATICVDAAGQNCIVVVPGANGALQVADVDALQPLIGAAALLVVQCESPLPAVWHAIGLARAASVPVILNPAPCRGLVLADLPRGISYLVPNESEAQALTGLPAGTVPEALVCAQQLQRAALGCAIITLGAQGCVVADADGARHVATLPVSAVDTTGAGDAFVGCLAAALAAGCTRPLAIRRALLYASLSTQRRGAMVSYPSGPEWQAAWQGQVR
jgi:ribokinase